MPLDAANQTLMDLLAQVSPAPLETLSAPEPGRLRGLERCRPRGRRGAAVDERELAGVPCIVVTRTLGAVPVLVCSTAVGS